MKLEELLEVLDENHYTYIRYDGETIAEYDGKNAIPKELNAAKVIRVRGDFYGVYVDIAPAVFWRVTVDGKDYNPYSPSVFCVSRDAIKQVYAMAQNDGIEIDRFDVVREEA